MWLAEISMPTIAQLPHPSEYHLEDVVAFAYRVSFPVLKKPVPRLERNRAERYVSRAREIKTNDGTDKKESKVKAAPQNSQIMLEPLIKILLMLAYHRTMLLLIYSRLLGAWRRN